MKCPNCKRRMRPLRARSRTGKIIREMPGVHYCKHCKLQAIDRAEVLKHRAMQKDLERGWEEEVPDPPKAS